MSRTPSLPSHLLALLALAAAVALSSACGPEPSAPEHSHAASAAADQELAVPGELAAAYLALSERSALRAAQLADSGDLRPQARLVLESLRGGGDGWTDLTAAGARQQHVALTSLPKTIKVWRKSLGGSDSCSGKVDTINLEDYVKGVLPHEWISSWKLDSLTAGSVAIRTYAVAWILKGGKYSCADLCDTTSSQVYKDSTLPVTNQAVDATAGKVLVTSSGSVVFAEYSAENGDPTKTGVSDPVCAGKALYGHGRGMCQWGSQRWAQQGKGWQWIALHYYPGASLWPAASSPDAGAPPPDTQPPLPPADSGSPAPDTTAPAFDSGVGAPDGVAPGGDLGLTPPIHRGRPDDGLVGGCAVGVAAAGASSRPGATTRSTPALLALALLLLVLLRRR